MILKIQSQNRSKKGLHFSHVALAGLAMLLTLQFNVPAFAAKNTVRVCSGFGCLYKDKMRFTDQDLSYISQSLSSGQGSADQERKTVALLVGWAERMAIKRLRLMRDTRLSYQFDSGKRGQMDCVDESTNTTSFLKLLQKRGLLKFHTVQRIASRGFLLDGRYPHRSAVLKDPRGQRWAIDSWKADGGGAAQVMDLASWKKERPGDY